MPYMGGIGKGLGGLGKLSRGLASFPAIGRGLGGFPRRMAAAVAAVFKQTQAEGVDFDGTNDYLSRSSDLIGNADGKTFTFSCWVYESNDGETWYYYDQRVSGGSQRFSFYRAASTYYLNALNSSGSAAVYTISFADAEVAAQTWTHILLSIDLTSTSKRHLYVNDVAVVPTYVAYANDSIDFTVERFAVGAANNTTSGPTAGDFKGRLSHLYLDYQYIDLSIEANRRLFITADRKPAPNQAALSPILYLPMRSPETCHINEGTGGDFVLNGVVARSGRGPNQFNAPYSDLNGTSQYLSRDVVLSGAASGKQITFHCVFNPDEISAAGRVFSIGTTYYDGFTVMLTSGYIRISGSNMSATQIIAVNTATGITAVGRSITLTLSVDLADSTKRKVIVNGIDVTPDSGWTYANDNMALAALSCRIGANNTTTPAAYFNGRLGNLYFDTKYIDLSKPENLAKFVTGTGIDCKPVDMGANGELPTGTPPLIYLPMYGNNAGKNYGTGGDFTVNGGPFPGARGPNEYWGNKAKFVGTGAINKSSALAGVTQSKVLSVSFWALVVSDSSYERIFLINTSGHANRLCIWRTSANNLQLIGINSGGSEVLRGNTTSAFASTDPFFVQACFDLSDTGKRFVWINGVLQTMTWATYVNADIEMTAPDVTFGGGADSQPSLDGKLSEFYFTTDYIDFSQESNRLKFRDAFGNPVDLKPQIEDGSIPKPAIYMRFDPANFGKNDGYGGDFNVVGSITDGGQL